MREGAYQLTLKGSGVRTEVFDLEVHPRKTPTARFDLEASLDSGTEAVLESQSGQINFMTVQVLARSVKDPERIVRAAPLLESPSDGLARFQLDGLSEGEWHLELQRVHHLPAFEPASGLRFDAAEERLRFLCLDGDDALVQDATLLVSDAKTKQPLSGGVAIWVAGESLLSQGFIANEAQLPGMRKGTLCDFAVIVPGYRPLFFEQEPFPPLRDGKPMQALLESGWGTVIVALELTGGSPGLAPIQGVEVVIDGVIAGRTDESGRCRLSADQPPAHIELRHPRLTHMSGGIDPQSGRLTTPGSGRPSWELFAEK
ncbi:MAG: hypothetical protein ACI8X5_004027 [Planctomycetota bacterium]